jgi:flagellar FliL protein
MLRTMFVFFFSLLLAGVSIQASASAAKKAGPVTPNSVYLPMEPSFVLNFGGAANFSGKTVKLRYLRADIVLRLLDTEAEELVKLHMPQLRHSLLILLSEQTEETLSSAASKEKIRLQALDIVRGLIKAQAHGAAHGEEKKEEDDSEEGKKKAALDKQRAETGGVTDLLFNNFLIQK